MTILFFSRHSKNWLDNWQRNSMAIRSSSLSIPSCMASGVKGTPGHLATILSLITRQQSAPGPICSKSSSSTFKKTPLLTNTQPDYSRVGNSELVDRTVRSNNWIRSDTIFIENEQIEALSNRPPWIAALLEQGLPGKPPDPTRRDMKEYPRQKT